MPMVLEYLIEEDIYMRLLLTCKSMKPSIAVLILNWYCDPETAIKRSDPARYLPLKVSIITAVDDHYDLTQYTHLTRVEFASWFPGPIQPGTMPLSVTSIEIGNDFDCPIASGTFPARLETLKFGTSFNQIIEPGVIPDSVTSLSFGSIYRVGAFDQHLAGWMPSSLTSLEFECNFNHPLPKGSLPPSLTSLSFRQFNQKLEIGSPPVNLKSLALGDSFNDPLDQFILPQSLHRLSIGKRFRKRLYLPPQLKNLSLSCPLANVEIINSFPLSLTQIELSGQSNVPLPAGLLPASVPTLAVPQPLLAGSVPSSVTTLSYHANKEIPIGAIPSSVEEPWDATLTIILWCLKNATTALLHLV